ncbi:glycoside hydrolase family 3 C-terminal domain-containing protein [Clostridium saudiense]|nr:glycoside hydrolase family 3 C-terminal domain-containing protein [Clostridium saudiense]
MKYTKKYTKSNLNEFTVYKNDNGVEIAVKDCGILEVDGYAFKNLSKSDKLLPYEDWRLSAEDRAKDLASRLSIDEIAGLMLYSSHQLVPARPMGPFVSHYDGKLYEEGVTVPYSLTDEQKKFLKEDNIRHFLQMKVDNAEISARWSNELQALAEAQPWGIPVNISTDPRHGASSSGAEFKNSGADVSKWPEGLGMSATFSPELCKRFAEVASKEYRALGITTALGPQIDLATEPRWMRYEDTFGGDKNLAINMTKSFCDGMQTTEGTKDGWGKDSVVTMAKHWPGGGTGEAGRDAHYAYGKYAVYPGKNFDNHKDVFVNGALKLDGPTKKAASIMPYYTISWNQDIKNGKNEGNSYNEYIIKDLLRGECDYDGVLCTDWGITGDPDSKIDSFGSRCFGVEELTEAERHLQIILNGVDQFGGNNSKAPIIEAYKIGSEKYGEDFMRKRMEQSARRLLTNIFRLGLFENPYLNPEESKNIVGSREFVEEGLEAQCKSIVMLKNKDNVLPLKKGIKVYIPDRYIKAKKNFFRMMDSEKHITPVSEDMSKGYFEIVKDPKLADVAMVFVESPLTDGYLEDKGYLPISLQYRPYTATLARKTSIAGGDFREEDSNRSYYNKTNYAYNESDLDNILEAKKLMGGKPIIVSMTLHNPTVVSEFEEVVDGIIVDFGVQRKALFDIVFGDKKPEGRLPIIMPKNMETIELHNEDIFDDIEAYTDSEGNTYDFGYGLTYK